jgi:hypothetical protein
VNETMVLNSSNYGPAFDDFCRLLTDGENMFVQKSIELSYPFGHSSHGIDPEGFEQAFFEDQTGCINGIDLQGNFIDSIALTIEDFQSIYHPPPHDDWATKLNLSLVFRGRSLFPNELALAIVGPLGRRSAVVTNNLTTMYLTALNGSRSRWAALEFLISWSTAVVGEPIFYVREFGTHNIRELITDGDDGYFQVHYPQSEARRYRERSFFKGQPGCFNGVDLEGNYVQDISLVLEEGSKYEGWENGRVTSTVIPKFVFSGSLGDGLTVCPDCECEPECDDGLPEHTIGTTVDILVLLTGWALFLI